MKFKSDVDVEAALAVSGDVGVGTTSPSFGTGGGLQISNAAQSNLRFTDTSNATFITDLALSNENFYLINRSASGSLKFRVNSSDEALTILSSGNVGIGTTTPVGKLEVVTTDANRYIRFKAPNGEERFQFYTGGTGNAAVLNMYSSDGTSRNVQIAAGGTSYFNGGNVGIGTTAPYLKFHVAGDTRVQGNLMVGTASASNTPTAAIHIKSSGVNAKLRIEDSDSVNQYWDFLVDQGNALYFNEDTDTRVTFKEGGNVGIGTTAPSSKLHIAGSDSNLVKIQSSNGEADIFYSSGISGGTDWQVGTGYPSAAGGAGSFFFYQGSATKLAITTDGDATFAGDISAVAGTFTNDITISNTSPELYLTNTNALKYNWMVAAQENVDQAFEITPSTVVGGSTYSTPALRIDGSNSNAAFAGAITVAGNQYFNGQFIEGDGKEMFRYSDGWLRINEDNDFGSGIYCGSGILRTDGEFQIGGSGQFTEITSAGVATFAGTVTAPTFLGDLNGTINTVTTAVTKANATNDTTVATTAFVQNLIGTIPAGLVFQGTWNAATNTPTLTSGSGTTGNFYIVSTSGSTNLDGVTDWVTGDWAVFIEQGGTDAWEKIDNSSVLDGAGTGQTLPLWSGSGTSNTLTNSIITQTGSSPSQQIRLTSANDAQLRLQGSNSYAGIYFVDNTQGDYIWYNGGQSTFAIGGGGSNVAGKKLHIDGSTSIGSNSDASSPPTNGLLVEGSVEIGSTGVAPLLFNKSTYGGMDTEAFYRIKFQEQGGVHNDVGIGQTATGNLGFNITAGKDFLFNGGTDGNALTLTAEGNATFAGDVRLALSATTQRILSSTGTDSIQIGDAGVNDIKFKNAAGNSVVILSSGNVGIGTTSPGAKLHVDGTAIFDTTTGTTPFYITRSGATDQALKLYVDDQNVVFESIQDETADDYGGFIFNMDAGTTEPYFDVRKNNSTLMRVDGGGNVGIGTTNPGSLLHISSGSSNQDAIVIIESDTDNNNENNNPQLQFKQDAGLTIAKIGLTGDPGTIFTNSLANTAYFGNDESAALQLYTNATARLTIEPGGDVGIGTTSPSYKLEVAGTVKATGYIAQSGTPIRLIVDNGALNDSTELRTGGGQFKLYSGRTSGAHQAFVFATGDNYTSGSERMRIGSNGDVGIGTTTPTAKLHVVGTGLFTGLVSGITPVAAANFVTKAYADAGDARVTPATPSTITSSVVGETIEIVFNQSATSNIDYYQVWSSDDGGDYGIIAQVTPADFSSTMTVVDTTFVTGGTMSYRIFAVREGIYSTAGTTSQSYTVGALDVFNMTVVNLNTAYYIQYEKPATRFIDHIEIYMDSQTTSAALNRSNATIVYSGQNSSYMRNVNASNNFHQFWVEIVTS